MNEAVIIQNDNYRIVFDRHTAGFPSSMALSGRLGWEEVVKGRQPWIKVLLKDNNAAFPYWPDDFMPNKRENEQSTVIEFINLPWKDENGNILEGFQLSLQYELWKSGTVFVNTYFIVEKTNPQEILGFQLKPPMQLPTEAEVAWAYWERPDTIDGSLIQALNNVERNLKIGDERYFDGTIVPYFGFDFGTGRIYNKHLEWFMEGMNSLTGNAKNVVTSLTWDGNNPYLEWEFVKNPVYSKNRPWQWRNLWGWVLCKAPEVRQHAPMRIYHYFDNFSRYPSNKQINKMANEGADVLILHENWRNDPQNGGLPYKQICFRRMVNDAHSKNIRVLLYVRGNERSVREGYCSWFDEILKKDFDGLYIDYGGPIHGMDFDENYPGGKVSFYQHFLTIKKLRERIGKNGIMLIHTGPFFSATSVAGLADGYVAGEGEGGILISDSTNHSYYSGLSVAAGTMWTAAFLDYHSKKAVPYMAAVGQYPHVTLGTQINSSSLSHPRETGNVTYMRPLWKLWGLFSDRKQVKLLHQQNTEKVFSTDSEKTAISLIQSLDGSTLVLVTNFDQVQRLVYAQIEWKNMDVIMPEYDWKVLKLESEQNPPSITEYQRIDHFEILLCGYGVVGWLLIPDLKVWEQKLSEFRKPYPEMDTEEREYLQWVENLRRIRFEPRAKKKSYFQVTVRNYPLAYEDSLWWDLFDTCYELLRIEENGEKMFLGYISSKGLVNEKPERGDYIWPGVETPWIPLHEILPLGKHTLEIRAKHLEADFYSFATARICEDPATFDNDYEIIFNNELDNDRSSMTFNIFII